MKQDQDMSNTFVAEVGQKNAIESLDIDNNSILSETNTELPKKNIEEVTKINEKNSNDNPNDNPKKSHPIITFLLMVLCLAIGVCGTYYYLEIFNNDSKVITSKQKTNSVSNIDTSSNEIVADGVFISDLLNKYDAYNVFETDIFTNLYSKDIVTANDLSQDYIKLLGAKEALYNNKQFSPNYFTVNQFHQAIKRLFGTSVTVADGDIGLPTYIYSSENQNYYYKEPEVGGASTYTLKRKVVKAIKKNKTLEVTVAVAILDGSRDGVYKSFNEDATDKVEGLTKETFDIEKDYNKLNEYKYTFNYDSSLDNYTFKQIELIK